MLTKRYCFWQSWMSCGTLFTVIMLTGYHLFDCVSVVSGQDISDDNMINNKDLSLENVKKESDFVKKSSEYSQLFTPPELVVNTMDTPNIPASTALLELESLSILNAPTSTKSDSSSQSKKLIENAADMDNVLSIVMHEGEINNYMYYWYIIMNNTNIDYVNNLHNFYQQNAIQMRFNYESTYQVMPLSHKENVTVNYELLRKPGDINSNYDILITSQPFTLKNRDLNILQSRGVISWQLLHEFNNNLKIMIGPQISTTMLSLADAQSHVILDNYLSSIGLDTFIYFQIPNHAYFAFSQIGLHVTHHYMKGAHVIFDIDIDQYNYYDSYFGKLSFGLGYNFNFHQNQQLSTLMSIGIAGFKRKDYKIHWGIMHNIQAYGHQDTASISDVTSKDWRVIVPNNNFKYMPFNIALQWRSNSFWLSENKKLIGIIPQIRLGVSWDLLTPSTEYAVDIKGEWSDLDTKINTVNAYRNINVALSKKIPKISRVMFHGEASLHISTEIIPDAQLNFAFSMNDEQVRYFISFIINIKI